MLAKKSQKQSAVKHHPALPYSEIGAFLSELNVHEVMARWALEFLILTACRTSEVCSAVWSEFDFDKKIWTIPGDRMKAGKEHRVPLVQRSIVILERVRPFSVGAFVFPGGVKDVALSNMAMAMLLRRMGHTGITVHGFRSTFRDWAGETTSHEFHVVEAALAHGLKDTRPHERAGMPQRVLLLDASGDHYSPMVLASTRCIAQLISDARAYMATVVGDLLSEQVANWTADPVSALNGVFQTAGLAPLDETQILARRLAEIVQEHQTEEEIVQEVTEEIVRQAEGSSSRGLDGYLRLLGIRAGFLYPIQKNPNKRLNPADRTLEVLVASTIDVRQPPIEYRDFLDLMRMRWGIVVGGRRDDALLLAGVGAAVPARALSENSERFLSRLEALGFLRRFVVVLNQAH